MKDGKYLLDNIPDYILEEIDQLTEKIESVLEPVLKENRSLFNTALDSYYSRVFAISLTRLKTENEKIEEIKIRLDTLIDQIFDNKNYLEEKLKNE